jgi:thiosulfate reductase cytochrome b subunit
MNKIYLYPKWVRLWHAINALSIMMLILTGISLHFSTKENPFIRFDLAVSLHNLFSEIIVFSYLFFIISNIVTKNGKSYRIERKELLRKLAKQSTYYLTGYFRGDEKPFPVSKESKFNPLQQITYVITMYLLVPLVIITGIAMIFPEAIVERFTTASGIKITVVFHTAIGFLISIFLIVHIYIASVGKHPLRNFKSIISGYHDES